jgi:hypothetical protein
LSEIDRLREAFGSEYADYLSNKQRGGSNSQKGAKYEDFFATYTIARLLSEFDPAQFQFVVIRAQQLAFVDDLLVELPRNSVRHYQCKNSTSVRWGCEMRSLSDDFEKQQTFNSSKGLHTFLALVVSDYSLAQSLREDLPDSIRGYTRVIHFPYKDSINKLLLESSEFRSDLRKICAFQEEDKLEALCVAIFSAWSACSGGNSNLEELIQSVDNFVPSYLAKPQLVTSEVLPELEKAFVNLPKLVTP